MDAQSKKTWGVLAVAALAVLMVRKMMDRSVNGGSTQARTVEFADKPRGIVVGGKDPSSSQQYLYRRSATSSHQGVDIEAPAGSAVLAAQRGVVAARWPDGAVDGYGNTILLQHRDGTQTMYSHLKRFAPGLQRGGAVSALQLVGYVGQTQSPLPPMKSKPHLHFEAHNTHTLRITRDSPDRVNPIDYLAERGLRVAA